MGADRLIRIVQMLTGGRRIQSRSLCSFGCTLGVVGFIRGLWVDPGARWGSSGSVVVVGFILVRPGGRCVHC